MKNLKLILIFALFLLVLPSVFSINEMTKNQTFSSQENISNSGCTFSGNCATCGGGTNFQFVHEFLNLSKTKTARRIILYNTSISGGGDGNYVMMFNPENVSTTTQYGIRYDTSNRVGLEDGSVTQLNIPISPAEPSNTIFDSEIWFDDLLNSSVNVTINRTIYMGNLKISSGTSGNWTFFRPFVQVATLKFCGIAEINGTQFPTGGLPDTTRPIVNISINNTSPKINDVINISCNMTDETGLKYINYTINFTTGKQYFNYSISGTRFELSNATTITDTRGNVLNITCYSTDTSNNVAQNSTKITIANTNPTQSNIFNTTNLHWNRNITINITPPTDADSDTLTYKWFRNSTSDLYPNLVQSSSATSYTTNETSDGSYFYFVNVSDGTATIQGLQWNWTLDTVTPTESHNITSGLITRFNQTIKITLTDVNAYNLTFRLYCGLEQHYYRTNSSPIGDELSIVQTINVSDGTCTGEINGSDSHTGTIMNELSKGKKGEIELVFNDTTKNMDNTMKLWFVEKSDKLTDTPADVKSFADFNDDKTKILFGVNFTVVKPETKIMFNVSSNKNIAYLNNTNYKGHLIWGKYGTDFEGVLLVNGVKRDYDVIVTRIDSNNVWVKIEPKSVLAGNDVVVFISYSVFGLNTIDTTFTMTQDTTPPSLNYFNISGYVNNSFTNKNYFNITVNGTDANNLSATVYVDNAFFAKASYQPNVSMNITNVNVGTDGNHTFKVKLNDTAGNEINSTYYYNLVIDTTTPTFVSATNRSTTDNTTTITTETDVNLTIFGLDDLYLKEGNFSHNASGSWVNYSISISGNQTPYYHIIGKGNFTANQVVGWKFYVFDTAGNLLDPIYTFEVGSITITTTSSSLEGGGGGLIGATRQCKEYSLIYKQCYYYEQSINVCVKGCPKEQICNNQYECVTSNITKEPLFASSALEPLKTPIQRFFDWIKQLLQPSIKKPKLSVFSLTNTEDKGTTETTSPAQALRQNIQQAIKINPSLPYIIIGALILFVALWYFGILAWIIQQWIALGMWGLILLFVVIIILFNLIRWF